MPTLPNTQPFLCLSSPNKFLAPGVAVGREATKHGAASGDEEDKKRLNAMTEIERYYIYTLSAVARVCEFA